MKNKKGFTLVELCVVIALTSIIVTMICSFISIYRLLLRNPQDRVDYINEINRAQLTVSSWVSRYDSKYYTISIADGGCGLNANPNGSAPSGSNLQSDSISFSNKVLTNGNANTTTKFSVVSTMSFSYAVDKVVQEDNTVVESTNPALIICHVTNGEDDGQKLIFGLKSQTSVNRYSAGHRTDTAKIQKVTDEWLEANKSSNIYIGTGDKAGQLCANSNVALLGDALVQKLYFQKTVTSKSTTRELYWYRRFAVIKNYYALSTVESITYSESANEELKCKIVFDDNTTEELVWTKQQWK